MKSEAERWDEWRALDMTVTVASKRQPNEAYTIALLGTEGRVKEYEKSNEFVFRKIKRRGIKY
ncbi:MAG: hypothetical protein ACRBG0_19235 [Lewinella sp.]|uniref:hypothetical protein n=1 Tax=Lewinella sp. TaxID=2004506 RepID=UPI003D6AC7B2